MPRLIAIGDIHGCGKALTAIVDQLELTSEDTLVTLGDYVDRGPNSAAVIEQLIALRDVCRLRPILGNHEAMMIMGLREPEEFEFWMSCGGQETVDSYGGNPENIPASHLDFLDACEMYVETDDHFFVHANYSADLALDRQQDYVLLWEHLTEHMPRRHQSGKQAIVGHTPQKDGEVLVRDHLICIDTFCYGGGWLTALDLQTQATVQADRHGNLRQ